MLLSYLPARLIIPKNRNGAWLIKWYQTNPDTLEREMFRETFGLNRVRCKRTRKRMANELVEDINGKLPTGWPFDNSYLDKLQQTNIIEAIETARDIKINETDRNGTVNYFSSKTSIFVAWLKSQKLEHLGVINFTDYHRQAFMDYLRLDRAVSGKTYNNYLDGMRSLFNELKQRKYITINHFSEQKKRREEAKMK